MKSSFQNGYAQKKDWTAGLASITAGASARADSGFCERAIGSLLCIVREHLRLDVVFIGEFVDDLRVFRRISSRMRLPFESVCQRIADGRIPNLLRDLGTARTVYGRPDRYANIGSHIGVPVRFTDGTLYGVLCGFSHETCPRLGERDVKRLSMAADATARLLAQADGYEISPAVPLRAYASIK